MKLKIYTTGILGSNRIASTLLLLIVPLISFQEFEAVCSLPIKTPQIQSGRSLPQQSQGDGKEGNRKPAERQRRDIGLVGANETAAGVIYHVNEREY